MTDLYGEAMRFLTALALTWTTFAAGAFATPGQPTDGGLGFQPAVTPIMEQVTSFHNILLVIITAITLLVMGLLIYVMIRFNRKANPTPSKNSHNTLLEVVWTAVPVLILIGIAVNLFLNFI